MLEKQGRVHGRAARVCVVWDEYNLVSRQGVGAVEELLVVLDLISALMRCPWGVGVVLALVVVAKGLAAEMSSLESL